MQILTRIPTTQRKFSIKTLWFSFRYNRRKQTRRANEPYSIANYDDVPLLALLLVFMVLGLSSLDAYHTLYIISKGGEELNPLLQVPLATHPLLFISLKISLSALGLLLFIFYARYKFLGWLPSYWLLLPVFGIYSILILYQLNLMEQVEHSMRILYFKPLTLYL